MRRAELGQPDPRARRAKRPGRLSADPNLPPAAGNPPECQQSEMGRLFIESVEGRAYSCKQCKTQLAQADKVLSKSFHSPGGKAYLFSSVVNTWPGRQEERCTEHAGHHVVEELHCILCMQVVGWLHVSSEDSASRCSEGKLILERNKILANDSSCSRPSASLTLTVNDDDLTVSAI